VGRVMAEMAADGPMWSVIKDKTGPGGIQSSKVQAILHVLADIPHEDKVLVFSMFTSVLDLIASAVPLHEYVQLDGDTKDRVGVLREFKTNPTCRILFVTYGVGGEGLNLVHANHVICVEPWWTYAVPDQAKARAWRPGQTKAVVMHDLAVRDSIEEHVLDICSAKRRMAQQFLGNRVLGSLSEAVQTSHARLDARTLAEILR
jgi:SNF2 family DNA or RNA helicase